MLDYLLSEKIIYIAGKYYEPSAGARLKNTHKMIDTGIELYETSDRQLIPHIPTLNHWIEERMDYLGYPERTNEYWYAFDNVILPKMDGLLKISKPGESMGADAEEVLAKKLHIPVFYTIQEALFHFRILDRCQKTLHGSS